MDSVTINGRTFQFESFTHEGELGDSSWTDFYEGIEKVNRKKYWLFGKSYVKEVPIYAFTIQEHSKDRSLTKKWWKEVIEKEIVMLDRAVELKQGRLI